MPAGTGRRDTRTGPVTRRLGYALLPGEGYSYILHLRPREWPIVAGHLLFGYFLAVAEVPAVLDRLPTAIFGTVVFVILLNGGTLAINSAFDRDLGDVGYLDDPPPPPAYLFGFGMAWMALGLVLAVVFLPRGFTAVYALCFAMAVAYSVPPFRWKAVAGLDIAINAIGFGVLTPLAGWLLSDAVPLLWAVLVLAGFGPLFAALYPLTQLYQMEEDRDRGDRTFALVLGMRASLRFALAMAILGLALMGAGLWLGFGLAASLWVLPPLVAWVTLLLRWLHRAPTMSPTDHKRGMYRSLQVWALTNASVLAGAFLPHLG